MCIMYKIIGREEVGYKDFSNEFYVYFKECVWSVSVRVSRGD